MKVLTCALCVCWQRMSIVDGKEMQIAKWKTAYTVLKRESVKEKYRSDSEITRLKRRNEALESELRELRQRPADSSPALNPQNEDLLTAITDMPGDELEYFATPSRKSNLMSGRPRVQCDKCGKEYARNSDDTLRAHDCVE